MHLRSVTLRGFKSFASATTLRFEPGITAVVGPNGSGKSNVVDALAWVMGEQGAKALRGGKMDDVIFAGTAGRPALGRAEVVLTIDNVDGALPIDYAEVTLSRIMFAGGGSEYAINGHACRLLDVQELLSDSGIGREMHIVVGQGQLDQVLAASPGERRGFIEEAAGVLKHRKRKEKALRKLDAMQANLVRVADLTTELRRQLGPLGRQAEVARRASVIQADLRDARLRLLADDLCRQREELAAEAAVEAAAAERYAAVGHDLVAAREEAAVVESVAADRASELARAQETWYRLAALRERVQGTAYLATERARHLAEAAESHPAGPDLELLAREAADVRRQRAELARQASLEADALDQAARARAAAEEALAAEDRRLSGLAAAAADRREGLARLQGQGAALRSRSAAAMEEIARLTAAVDRAKGRADRARDAFTELESQVASLDSGEVDLDAEHESATTELASSEGRVAALREEERRAERERVAASARVEALELSLARGDGAGVLLDAGAAHPGVIGPLAGLVRICEGYEAAVAAALGTAADAVAVGSLADATLALRRLRTEDAGSAGMVVADPSHPLAPSPGTGDLADLPAGVRPVVDVVEVLEDSAALGAALHRLVGRHVIVDDLDTAVALVGRRTELCAVTVDGDVLTAAYASGGSGRVPSRLELQAAVAEATARLAAAEHHGERLRFELVGVEDARTEAAARAHAALSRLHESDARHAAVGEQLGQLGAAARAAAEEAQRLTAAVAESRAAHERDLAGLVDLEQRLATLAAAAPDEDAELTVADDRAQLATACAVARQQEVDARLAARSTEERAAGLARRAEQLEGAVERERRARAHSAHRMARRAEDSRVAQAVAEGAQLVLTRIDDSLGQAASARETAERDRTAREVELAVLRERTAALAAELAELTTVLHRDEVARAELRLRVEVLEDRAVAELGVNPDLLVAEFGPHLPVPTGDGSGGPDGDGAGERPYDRADQEKRLRAAERSLALLGRVNPLALEEYTALEERHAFLTGQLEDLEATRRDLLTVVREVDERVEQVFAAAFADTAREFGDVFARLFPGGEGRLLLTDPHDVLTSGIEVEARPPGKKVKRLSLLSGGERSLTAMAFLVAIFKARPSPFYLLDEVEAALDDVNLGRLLGLLQELRESSQLILVTHQKRTMEIADALYGVSMRNDGVSAVISQRIRERELASDRA